MREYFEGLEAIRQRFNHDIDSLSVDVSRGLNLVTADTPESVGIDLIVDFLTAFRDIFERITNDLRAIDPPMEVTATHDLMMEAYLEWAESLKLSIQNVAQLTSLQMATSELSSFLELPVDDREVIACWELQDLAYTYHIDADLMCGRPPTGLTVSSQEYGGKGEYLGIGAYRPRMLDNVICTFAGQNYVITSQNEGFQIAAVRARAVNLSLTEVAMSIDEDSALLTTTGGDEFKPFEPGARAIKTSEPAPEDNPYGSHIWGQFQLIQNFEIAGWFFFDVPKDSKFLSFTWHEVEFIRVLYPP